MPVAKWVDFAAEAIFHTFVAALVVEALLRLWRVAAPGERLAFRLVSLGYPLLVLPAYTLLVPLRREERFRESWALLTGRRWDELRLLGASAYDLWIALFVALGTVLFLMDLVPLVRGRRATPRPGDDSREGRSVAAELATVAAAVGVTPPRVAFLEEGGPVLFCAGARRTELVISRSTVQLLDRHELRAALAHELAHLRERDPAASWVIMAARATMFFNPAFQVLARAMASEAERRADERAAAAVGDRLALASGLLKLFRATEGRPAAPGRRNLPLAAALTVPITRARAADIEARCRRLLAPAPAVLPLATLRLGVTAAGLSALLFFVV